MTAQADTIPTYNEENAGGDHILACISASPTSGHVLEEAAVVAHMLNARFTAVHVQSDAGRPLSAKENATLQENIEKAKKAGARVVSLNGQDIAYEIAHYARLSGVTRIVIGQSAFSGGRLFSKSLTDKLLEYAPGIDIYIIPDRKAMPRLDQGSRQKPVFYLRDLISCILVFLLSTAICELFRKMHFSEANIIMVYILATVVNSVITEHRIYGLVSSLLGIFLFNYLFTEPRFTLFVYETGYQSTFLIMFLVAFITGSLAENLRAKARESAEVAYRTQILLDTNVMLEKVRGEEEILSASLRQMEKLLERKIVFTREIREGTDDKDGFEYFTLKVRDEAIGSVGVDGTQDPLHYYERSLLQSVMGECSLALENDRNRKAREEAELKAQAETLRANLLRTISHDLRTPLTAISGHASNLLTEESRIDAGTRQEMYKDIYDESLWLIDLVENLLSISRIVDGRMQLQMETEDLRDIVEESISHIRIKSGEHLLRTAFGEEIILIKGDARLLMQVVINLVNNAVRYTRPGSEILVTCRREGSVAKVCVSDNGPGIPDAEKEKIFEMFYSLSNTGGDSVRSTGLGLALCRSIIDAHGGEIHAEDNIPCGSRFVFTLPALEVNMHE